jgi:hypothetical protein
MQTMQKKKHAIPKSEAYHLQELFISFWHISQEGCVILYIKQIFQ